MVHHLLNQGGWHTEILNYHYISSNLQRELPFHDMIVNVGRNDGDSDDITTLINDVPNVFILHPDNILTIHL